MEHSVDNQTQILQHQTTHKVPQIAEKPVELLCKQISCNKTTRKQHLVAFNLLRE